MKLKLVSEITNKMKKHSSTYDTELLLEKDGTFTIFKFKDPKFNIDNKIKFSKEYVSLTFGSNYMPLDAHKETVLDISSTDGKVSAIAKLMATGSKDNKYYIKYGIKSSLDTEIAIYEIYLYII